MSESTEFFEQHNKQMLFPKSIIANNINIEESGKQGLGINKKINIEIATLIINARILIKHNESNVALHLLRQALNQEPKNIVVMEIMAEVLNKLGKTEEEITIRNQIIKQEYNFENVYKKARCLYKMGDDNSALSFYFESLSLLNGDAKELFDMYRELGNILLRQGDFDGAEEYYNKSYTLNSQSDVLLVNLGTLEIQKQDFEKALVCFRKALDLNKLNEKAWVGLAMVHRAYGDFELAWANIKEAIEINPRNRTSALLISNWAKQDGKIEYAIETLQNYLDSESYDSELALVLINFMCETGDVFGAKLESERFALWNPENEEIFDLRKKLNGVKK